MIIIMRAFLFCGGILYRRCRSVRLGAVALGWAAVAHSAEQSFSSGNHRVALIELFSSEGCSSCPPAERWLGELRSAPGLWRDFVPVAFHVDYWNRLGWPDRFSTREFTERQYAWAKSAGSASVYTPCFVRDGAEWRPQNGPLAPGGVAGVLNLVVGDDGVCRVEFYPGDREASLDVHVAVLGGGFLSNVTAGENRGAKLPQEFVALALVDHALAAGAATHRAEFPLPQAQITDAARRAVVAWVTRRGELSPLQAVGGWLK